jgi:hypothetical protein
LAIKPIYMPKLFFLLCDHSRRIETHLEFFPPESVFSRRPAATYFSDSFSSGVAAVPVILACSWLPDTNMHEGYSIGRSVACTCLSLAGRNRKPYGVESSDQVVQL